MKKKVFMLLLWLVLICGCAVAIWQFEKNSIGIGEALAGALIAVFIEKLWEAVQDLMDNTDWKASQRRLKRGKFISDDTIVRISFAYLYRIKIGNKYMLVQNERNTGKYQPVGGVYKMLGNEKYELKNCYNVMDDNKIPIDESSKDDYRLRLRNKKLRSFVRRFDKKAERERIDNIGREFKEELIDTGILDWSQITYRYCGRHISDLSYGEHFQIYELLLADVVELIPTKEQEAELHNLMTNRSDKYRFVTTEQIDCLGMDIDAGQLYEWIADHSKKMIQEQEYKLKRMKEAGRRYTVSLKNASDV